VADLEIFAAIVPQPVFFLPAVASISDRLRRGFLNTQLCGVNILVGACHCYIWSYRGFRHATSASPPVRPWLRPMTSDG
jgi:hypothetical protein